MGNILCNWSSKGIVRFPINIAGRKHHLCKVFQKSMSTTGFGGTLTFPHSNLLIHAAGRRVYSVEAASRRLLQP